jgi:hypothetical protein
MVNVDNAETITCTLVRKYTATVSQLLTLEENQLEWLCNHMGHSIQVHRQFYRQVYSCFKIVLNYFRDLESDVYSSAGE